MKTLHPAPVARLSVMLLAFLAFLLAAGAGAAEAPRTERARQDLAKRLSIPLERIEVTSERPVTFPDASLGLSRANEFYAAVETRGSVLVLRAEQCGSYLYTASDRALRYGGPLNAWRYSALALHPVENEPNLNGNLVQTSLVGTNPQVILEAVDGFFPQEDGSILATRRTSRSGYELLHLASGKSGQPTRLLSTFYASLATLDPSHTRWAAVVRPRLGSYYALTRNGLAASPEHATTLQLPEGRPTGLFWKEANPVVQMEEGGKVRSYQLEGERWQELERYDPVGSDLMLNKSESLEVGSTLDGKGTEVRRVWFTGDAKMVATIPNFQVREYSLAPGQEFVLLSGRSGEEGRAFAVDVQTGEVLPLPDFSRGETRLLNAPPQAWKRLEKWIKP